MQCACWWFLPTHITLTVAVCTFQFNRYEGHLGKLPLFEWNVQLLVFQRKYPRFRTSLLLSDFWSYLLDANIRKIKQKQVFFRDFLRMIYCHNGSSCQFAGKPIARESTFG